MKSVAEILGAWVEQSFDSSLIQCCKDNWTIPVDELTNAALATFVRQEFALEIVLDEAKKRIASGYLDDTEKYDEELEVAVNGVRKT